MRMSDHKGQNHSNHNASVISVSALFLYSRYFKFLCFPFSSSIIIFMVSLYATKMAVWGILIRLFCKKVRYTRNKKQFPCINNFQNILPPQNILNINFMQKKHLLSDLLIFKNAESTMHNNE